MWRKGHSGPSTRMWLTAYFLIGLVLVGIGGLLFAGHTTRKMERQSSALTNVFSLFLSETVFQAERPGAAELIQSVLSEIDFPVIITTADGTPFVWRVEGVPPQEDDDPFVLARPDLTPEQRDTRARLDALMREFDAAHPPYPIQVDGAVQGYVHFGPSALTRQLRWMPAVLIVAVAVFAAIGLLGFRSIKTSEQRSIWVGMARETAHQLGTPLTSLLGWVQLLQSDDAVRDGETPEQAEERRRKTYQEMQHDLGRLAKVSARFSKIGSAPDLAALDIAEVVDETVRYIKRRAPHLGAPVQIEAHLQPLPPVLANRELIEWVFENLLKNALDALENGGEIRVQASSNGADQVELRVRDSGRGIAPSVRQRIFDPGFTTKKRGWGLGLTLVRRIIEEYHGGRIWVEDNPDRRGACFAIRLPVAR